MLNKVFSGALFFLCPLTLAQSLKRRKCKVLACAHDGDVHKEGHKEFMSQFLTEQQNEENLCQLGI